MKRESIPILLAERSEMGKSWQIFDNVSVLLCAENISVYVISGGHQLLTDTEVMPLALFFGTDGD